jgi:hypothetical protein
MNRSRLVVVLAVTIVIACVANTHAQYSRHATGGGYGGYRGGHGGAASLNPGLGRPNNLSLVVSQTQEGHDGVSDLLNQLRRMKDQQVLNQVNFHQLNDSFYERNGVGFGFNIRGGEGVVGLDPTGQRTSNGDIQFRQGSANSALPPFGGFDPSAQNTVGFGTSGSGGDLLFNFFGSQGSNRSMTTTSPVVTITNGTQGTVSDTSQVPIVTGTIPVVGGMNVPAFVGYQQPVAPVFRSPVQDRADRLRYGELQRLSQGTRDADPEAKPNVLVGGGGAGASGGPSSADRGAVSVAEIRRQQASGASSEDVELASWLERARGAEAAGKPSVAKIYYRMAAKRATGAQQAEINQKLRKLGQ